MLKWSRNAKPFGPLSVTAGPDDRDPGEIGQGQEANIGQKLGTIRGKVKGNGRQRRRGDAECRPTHRTQLKLQQGLTPFAW
jgi:hypothetical protein